MGKRTRNFEFPMTDVADVLGVSRYTVKRWLESGRLEGTRLEDLLKFVYVKGWQDALEESSGNNGRLKHFAPADGYRKHRKM